MKVELHVSVAKSIHTHALLIVRGMAGLFKFNFHIITRC